MYMADVFDYVCDTVDALTIDGQVVQLRGATLDDRPALHDIINRCSDRSVFLRFFSINRDFALRYVDELLDRQDSRGGTHVAVLDREVVGFATWLPVTGSRAEIAVLVDDDRQHQGIGTLLLENLASRARTEGFCEFEADVLSENASMLRVLQDLGYSVSMRRSGAETHVVWRLAPGAGTSASVSQHERIATARSLRSLLMPTSVAVIGATERERSVGRAVLERLLRTFVGRVFEINPHHRRVLGQPCYSSVGSLPETPDLAVLAVPAQAAVDAARECAAVGVRSLLVLGSGFREVGVDGARLEDDLISVARSHGMRLVGPNCLGVLNTDPSVRLSASLAALSDRPGRIGLAAQSGALGIAAVADLTRHGTGVSQFVSLGNKADVSGNDLLQWWHQDDRTSVIGLYLESFGNPTRFRRIAGELARTKPVVAIKAGRSTAGLRAGSSHTAAAASPDDLVSALCAQSGVARVDTLEQLVGALRVMESQPLPAGPRIAIVGNSGGPGILAADQAEASGLQVPILSDKTAGRVREAAPKAAADANPIDLGAEMTAATLGAALAVLGDCEEVDAIAVVVCQTGSISGAELAESLGRIPSTDKPVVVTALGPEPLAIGPDVPPVFDYPEAAVSALGTAWRCAQLREQTAAAALVEPVPPVSRALLTGIADGWLTAEQATRLVAHYGITTPPAQIAHSLDEAHQIADHMGYPVVAKTQAAVHKSEVGGVRVDIRNLDELRTAYAELSRLGNDVVIQPLVVGSAELLVGGVRHAAFGPAVVLAAGGVTTDLVADRATRLAPLTAGDADQMMSQLRCRAVFDGFRGASPVSRSGVRDLLLAVSRLLVEQPRVVELDLNPVRCAGAALTAVDVKVRIAPPHPGPDPLERALNPRSRRAVQDA
jgi:acyl-CoA synthetase (NDP forming)/GNAT superfamily N-acetyltransferase